MTELSKFAQELDAKFKDLKETNILRTPGIETQINIPENQEMELIKLIYILWGIERHHPRKAVVGSLRFVR